MLDFNQFEVVSFDCYGTLIDWESGILPVLKQLLSNREIDFSDEGTLEMFAEFESELEKDKGEYIKYREILQEIVRKIGKRFSFEPTETESATEINCLVESIKNWQPFPDTVAALRALKQKYKLAVISNIDDDLFVGTAKHLKVEFDWVITAEQVRSYKPSTRNFEMAIEKMGIPPSKLLHVAQSLYHDIVPASYMGISTVWVNRRYDRTGFGATLPASAQPDLEVPDLTTLVEAIA
ncbi:MAG: haloacid dehalogenase type II [Microcoleus sp. PH2017_01_SCD_O_A]|uniref:haloacid dehalogenase type II n=1 Tax=unclassified Microcoleus TaxID=2642155 RepID=UPI001E13C522|nr:MULTISPECIES: haloacid dehalogenase type II [unclassified Microcoleus]TAF84793.1 MAG: haloacid dehalogenase type II [Oscillatoriales cyanobacterium]MCC3426893.1 haloacid dehalogenase type II [Microcoleus sp. PH2017_01_SCD_O_A]MCC3451131.1 haloacid dehalogenase type II [Microcoleus sp. PH2017_09_SFU_O_A]MCC3568983.1 haloacid dehalogenase type II [Microcoleus sp. PH2017_31_RDM_U_A]MCC3580650.1 haloacid dehalogenase type II [Microcoleus sp. PH2017_32_RDM_D_A]